MADIKNGESENIEQGAYYLFDAPIAELAEYKGVDIDEAVKMRVAAAVEAAPPKMEITVRPIEPKGNLYGFASVAIGGITVDDFKIVENKDGELFAGMPSKPDKGSKTGYRNTVHVDKDLRDDFNAAVISEYHAAVEQTQARAANLKTAPDKKPIKAQMAEATAQAAKDNAARPDPAKGKAKNAER